MKIRSVEIAEEFSLQIMDTVSNLSHDIVNYSEIRNSLNGWKEKYLEQKIVRFQRPNYVEDMQSDMPMSV